MISGVIIFRTGSSASMRCLNLFLTWYVNNKISVTISKRMNPVCKCWKKPEKTAQSDKWMWVTRGGSPYKPSVLFDYNPTRAGHRPACLLKGVSGVLQVDGYSGYARTIVTLISPASAVGIMLDASLSRQHAVQLLKKKKATKPSRLKSMWSSLKSERSILLKAK